MGTFRFKSRATLRSGWEDELCVGAIPNAFGGVTIRSEGTHHLGRLVRVNAGPDVVLSRAETEALIARLQAVLRGEEVGHAG